MGDSYDADGELAASNQEIWEHWSLLRDGAPYKGGSGMFLEGGVYYIGRDYSGGAFGISPISGNNWSNYVFGSGYNASLMSQNKFWEHYGVTDGNRADFAIGFAGSRNTFVYKRYIKWEEEFANGDDNLFDSNGGSLVGTIKWRLEVDQNTGAQAGFGLDAILNPGVDFTVGGLDYQLGRTLDKRLAYDFTRPSYQGWSKSPANVPPTSFKVPGGRINVPTPLVRGAANVLKVGGAALGMVGVGMTGYEIYTGEKSLIGEGGLDLIMGGVAFIPGGGWIVSGAYFGGKALLEYTGNDFWNKQ